MTASPLPTRTTIAATINKGVFIVLVCGSQWPLTYRALDERALNGRYNPSVAGYYVVWRVPHGLFRRREDFCSFDLIIKY